MVKEAILHLLLLQNATISTKSTQLKKSIMSAPLITSFLSSPTLPGRFLWKIPALLWVNKKQPEVHFIQGESASTSGMSFPPSREHSGAVLNAGAMVMNELAVWVQVW